MTTIRTIIAWWGIVALSLIPLTSTFTQVVSGDVRHYHSLMTKIEAGDVPYSEVELEYPPYAFLLFVIPSILNSNVETFSTLFIVEMFLLHALTAFLIMRFSFLHFSREHRYIPLILFVLSALFQIHYYLRRFDVALAALIVFTFWALEKEKYTLAGFFLTASIFVKFSPIVYTPIILYYVYKQLKLKKFMWGIGIATLPIFLLSFYAPWWKFFSFHLSRGYQAESLFASIIWLKHKLFDLQATWLYAKGWYEVQSPWLTHAKILTATLLLISISYSLYKAYQIIKTREQTTKEKLSLEELAYLCLLPLLAFVAFNTVFSPQFLVWLIPLALLIFRIYPSASIYLVIATALTIFIYPTDDYYTGLTLMHTCILVIRNVGFVVLWFVMTKQVLVILSQAPKVLPSQE
jgi:hypothetical protein